MLTVRETPWDARVLGVDAEEIVVDASDIREALGAYETRCAILQVGFTSVRFDATQSDTRLALEEAGYRQVGTYFKVCNDVSRWPPRIPLPDLPSGVATRAATADDLPRLREMVMNWFAFGPFFDDPRITFHAAKLRMCNRLGSLLTDARLVVCPTEGKPMAFFAYGPPAKTVELILAGVAPGPIHGRPFWASVITDIYRAGATEAWGYISAANLPVMNLYASLGFRFVETRLQYHRHRT